MVAAVIGYQKPSQWMQFQAVFWEKPVSPCSTRISEIDGLG